MAITGCGCFYIPGSWILASPPVIEEDADIFIIPQASLEPILSNAQKYIDGHSTLEEVTPPQAGDKPSHIFGAKFFESVDLVKGAPFSGKSLRVNESNTVDLDTEANIITGALAIAPPNRFYITGNTYLIPNTVISNVAIGSDSASLPSLEPVGYYDNVLDLYAQDVINLQLRSTHILENLGEIV